MRNNSGINLIESLVALTLVSILFFPMIDLINNTFIAEYKTKQTVLSKQNKDTVFTRITSNLKEASYLYPKWTSVMLPNNEYLMVAYNGVAGLVPMYDSNGDVVYDSSTNETQFQGFAYHITYPDWSESIPKSKIIETQVPITCATSPSNMMVPTGSCTTEWGAGTSNIIIDKVNSGWVDNYDPVSQTYSSNYYSPFDINTTNNGVKLIFAIKEGELYAPGFGSTVLSQDELQTVNIFCNNTRI